MAVMHGVKRPRSDQGGGSFRATRAGLLGGVVGRCRALKRRLADILMRGDRDYAILSAASQEIGRMRQ